MAYDFSNVAYIKRADGTEIKQINGIWTKPYVWKKHNVITTPKYSYSEQYNGIKYRNQISSNYAIYRDYSIINGKFVGGFTWYDSYSDAYYGSKYREYPYVIFNNGATLHEYLSVGYATDSSGYNYFASYKEYTIKTTTTNSYSKGSYINNTSASSNSYPSNGRSGNFWYVLISQPNVAGFNPNNL